MVAFGVNMRQVLLPFQVWSREGRWRCPHSGEAQVTVEHRNRCDFNLFFMWYIHTAHNAFCATSFVTYVFIYFYLYSIIFKIAVQPRGQLSAFHCPFIVGKNAMNKNLNLTCRIILSLVSENSTCARPVVWWRCLILPMQSFSSLKSAEFQQRHFIGHADRSVFCESWAPRPTYHNCKSHTWADVS